MKTKIALLLALLSILCAGKASASGGAPLYTATPHAPIISTPAPYCQFDVYKGTLTIEKRGSTNAGRYISVIVENNTHDRAIALHGYMHTDNGDGIWTHSVWHTYTQANITAAWVSGHRCEGT